MLHTKAAGNAQSIVVGSACACLSPLVCFQHGLELGVSDDVHGGRKRDTEMQLYAQVALMYQMEAGAITLVGGQVKTEEGVAVPVVAASQPVSLVLPHLAGRGEQAHVAPYEEIVFEIRLERFGGYLSSDHVHCVEADGVVVGMIRILGVHTVVRIVIYAAQHQTFRRSAEEQVLSVGELGPAGMEYTLQSTERIGYLTVLFSRAMMCAICTVGLRVAFFANKVALTMFIL